MKDAQTVLEAFGWPSQTSLEIRAILATTAEAQNLFGGNTFVSLGKAFAELPELFAAFRAALALDTPTESLQRLLLAGMLGPKEPPTKETP